MTANFDAPESTLTTEAKLPMEPIENAEPMEPIDMNDPYEPMDRHELRENALSTDCRDLIERMELMLISDSMNEVSHRSNRDGLVTSSSRHSPLTRWLAREPLLELGILLIPPLDNLVGELSRGYLGDRGELLSLRDEDPTRHE